MSNIMQWPLGMLDFSSPPLIMGILNVTPDSFSDGGRFLDVNAAVEHGLQMVAEGAAIIDVGPESSRPGSRRISAAGQIHRAVPVIERLVSKVHVPISIDTYLPEVACAALDAGASIINDISGLSNKEMISLLIRKRAIVIIMHMLGTPETMQSDPRYADVTSEVLDFLLARAAAAESAGLPRDRIIVDPGIGFGKTTEHNLQLLRDLGRFVDSGYRVLMGPSRKRFIGELTDRPDPAYRLFGTAAVCAHCTAAGVSILRVHDVAPILDVIKLTRAIRQ